MTLFALPGMLLAYRRALGPFLGEPAPTAEECRARLGARREGSSAAFVDLVERGVFGRARGPYRVLFEWAGLTAADVRELVERDGLAEALGRLHEAGVFVSLDEFKGREPIRRGSGEWVARASDFDGPLLSPHFEGRTGGTRGPSRRLLVDLSLIAADADAHRVFLDGIGVSDRIHAVWRPVPPDNSGVKKALMSARLGLPLERWFSHTAPSWSPGMARYALFERYTRWRARRRGRPYPAPEPTPLGAAHEVVDWLADCRRTGRDVYFDTLVSSAVRICRLATEHGLSIAGTVFRVGGEPLTEARARVIEGAGCAVYAHYAMSETGPLAMGCAHPNRPGDAHVRLDKVALTLAPAVTTPAMVDPEVGPGPADEVGPLFATTLMGSSPKLLINVETGDAGRLERRSCGCAFDELGFDQHVWVLGSYRRITFEGMTFMETDLIGVLEDRLPAAFGGVATDYQLIARAGAPGPDRLELRVSPRIGVLDERGVAKVFLEGLEASGAGHRLMAEVWSQAGTLAVTRCEPEATPGASKLNAVLRRVES